MQQQQQYHPGTDISLDAALRVLMLKGFKRLTDPEWIFACTAFKQNDFEFATFDQIAKKTLGYDQHGIFKAWNSIPDANGSGRPSLTWTIKAARERDKELFQTMKKTLATGNGEESLPERKADKIAWLLRNYKIEYNELRDAVYVNGEMLSDVINATIYYDMMNHGVNSCQAIDSVILTISQQNTYHPIKQYLTRVCREYDGSKQLEHLCTYFSDVSGVFPLFFRKWAIGSVSKIFKHTQNPMLVLMGAQGCGKGFFVDWLCPLRELLLSSPILPDNKDHMLRACDRWIWEVVELGSTTRRADMESLKAFLMQKFFTVRRPYGHFDLDKYTTVSFIGTMNDDGAGFLSDVTGNRRYRPMTLTTLNWAYTQHIDINMLWGQIMSLYEAGESPDLDTKETITLNSVILPKYKREDILEDLISQHVEQSDSLMTSHEILLFLYRIGFQGKRSRADAMDLSNVMKLLEFKKTKIDGKHGYLCRIKAESLENSKFEKEMYQS